MFRLQICGSEPIRKKVLLKFLNDDDDQWPIL